MLGADIADIYTGIYGPSQHRIALWIYLAGPGQLWIYLAGTRVALCQCMRTCGDSPLLDP